ncbi:hypothetical protein AOLI_G00205850 [Acnodon oligacanthus]
MQRAGFIETKETLGVTSSHGTKERRSSCPQKLNLRQHSAQAEGYGISKFLLFCHKYAPVMFEHLMERLLEEVPPQECLVFLYNILGPRSSLVHQAEITCPNPNVLDNGVVEPYKLLYYVIDTTTYRCHSDYTFRGSSTRVCQLNLKWSGSTPICSHDSDHCPDPGTPPGTSRTGHIFNIDDKVTYRCDNKLKLLGSKVRVCQDGGQWSGREPECYADFTYDTPVEVAVAFGRTLKTTLTTHVDNGWDKINLSADVKLTSAMAVERAGERGLGTRAAAA